MELFVTPWAMIFGGILISAPILIHLINRMRFKRLRWAAMEFLLKSQKRNRRKLIIEQLILLLLRIFLVLLAGFLVARFVGAKTRSNDDTLNVVVIDDTLSMTDAHVPEGSDPKNPPPAIRAYEKAKEELATLAETLARAPTPQTLVVLAMSDPTKELFREAVVATTVDKLKAEMIKWQPTALHVHPLKSVKLMTNVLTDERVKGLKVAFLISDFRELDWVPGSEAKELQKAIDNLLDKGINVNLIDVAHQYRSDTQGVALHHNNLAILELKAETRVAAEGRPIDFTVVIQNYGTTNQKGQLDVLVNGIPDPGATKVIPVLPALQKTEVEFTLLFNRGKNAPPDDREATLAEREQRRRADREYQSVSVTLDDFDGGLQADNVRDMIIEVRKRIPVLIIDGNRDVEAKKSGSDEHLLRVAAESARSYEVETKMLEAVDDDKDQTDLSLYPIIYLTNVKQIKTVRFLKRLDDYVRNGGSTVFCLGDQIEPGFYNTTLNKNYKGLFPVKIKDTAVPEMEEKERRYSISEDPQPKIVPTPRGLEISPELKQPKIEYGYLPYLLIDRYYPCEAPAKWEGEEKAEMLLAVARRKDDPTIDEIIKKRAQRLLADADTEVAELAKEDKSFVDHTKLFDLKGRFGAAVKSALEDVNVCYQLTRVLDVMLSDPGEKGKESERPNMLDLWANKKMRRLASDLAELRDLAKYGDPLLVARKHGKGTTVALLTSAGTLPQRNSKNDGQVRWSEWGSGYAAPTFVTVIMDLQRYLTSESHGLNFIVGEEALELSFNPKEYQPDVVVRFREQVPPKRPPRTAPKDDKPIEKPDVDKKGDGSIELPKVQMKERDGQLIFRYTAFQKPGVYYFDFKPVNTLAHKAPPLTRAFAYNVDADTESDLKGAATESLVRSTEEAAPGKGVLKLQSPGEQKEITKEKEPDMSETPWIYLIVLLVLVAEQAMAVHLSFHLKGSENLGAPPTRMPAAA